MKFVKLTTQGRVTIPAPLRKKYGLTPGRQVEIIPLATPAEIRANIGFLGMTSLEPGKKGKLLKSLMEEKKREREL